MTDCLAALSRHKPMPHERRRNPPLLPRRAANDVLFLRDRFGLRPGVNVAIVVVFGAIYLIFLRHF
jgi:hypothetical protein